MYTDPFAPHRYGWGTLCLAGGGAYYFAKREINADRAARHSNEMAKQQRIAELRRQKAAEKGADSHVGTHSHRGLDHAGSPSSEASEDAAPVGHAPETPEQRMTEKSKYEAAEPYRSKKGNRFS